MRTTLLLGTTLSGVATVLGIVSTAIPYWISHGSGKLKIHEGLWQACILDPVSSASVCTEISLKDVHDWARAVQAFTIIGIVCLALGTMLAGCYIVNASLTNRLTFSGLSSLAGGLSFALAVIIYYAKTKGTEADYLAGFFLGIVVVFVAIIAAIAIFLSKRAAGYSSI